jgi:hypothetical protein
VLGYLGLAAAFFLAVPAVPSADATEIVFGRAAFLAVLLFAASRWALRRVGPRHADTVVESLLFLALVRAIHERLALS